MTTRLAAMIAVFISMVAAVVDGIKVPFETCFGQRPDIRFRYSGMGI